MPMPKCYMAGTVEALYYLNEEEAGLKLATSFPSYARPGEMETLFAEDIIPTIGQEFHHTAVVIRPFERGAPTKVGEYDDTVPMDTVGMEFLGQMLENLAAAKQPGEKLFRQSQEQHARVLGRGFRAVGLKGQVPYGPRHGGAAHDRLRRHRSMPEIKKRGRWKHDKSVVRYERAGRIQQVIERTDRAARDYCKFAEQHLESIMMRGRAPRRPPYLGA